MMVDVLRVLHQALFGAVAASGFGILFNFGWRDLRWCAASGALALTTRTIAQDANWSLECHVCCCCGGGLWWAIIACPFGGCQHFSGGRWMHSNGSRFLRRSGNFRFVRPD
jgi:hypothetical protein